MLMRFEDGRVATMDVSWSSKGGLEGRFEAYRRRRPIIQDMASSPLRAFIEQPAGYLGEKVDADTGWVFPVPNETYVHGHDAMMGRHRRGLPRRPSRRARRSTTGSPSTRSSTPPTARCEAAAGRPSSLGPGGRPDDRRAHRRRSTPALAWMAEAPRRCSSASPRPRPTPSRQASQLVRRRDRRAMASSTSSGPATRASRSRRCSRATARIPGSTRSSSCR